LRFFLFDTRYMAEISSLDYPDERLVVCKNPLLAADRKRKRDEWLALAATDLGKIRARVTRDKNPLCGLPRSARPSARSSASKMAKHFELTITDDAFGFTRKAKAIADEASFAGFYGLRTSQARQSSGVTCGAGRCRWHVAGDCRAARLGAGMRHTPVAGPRQHGMASLRVGIFDGAFTADRCRESANVHGMRHHLVSRDPDQGVHRAAPALARDRLYRVAKLRFEWSATIKRDHLRLGSCESIQVQLSFHRVPPVGVC
jgi:hypothetical protein